MHMHKTNLLTARKHQSSDRVVDRVVDCKFERAVGSVLPKLARTAETVPRPSWRGCFSSFHGRISHAERHACHRVWSFATAASRNNTLPRHAAQDRTERNIIVSLGGALTNVYSCVAGE
jgi:hypothetical protein